MEIQLPALSKDQSVLISGASFAGLAAAWWMNRLGFSVTIVEIAPGLRKGGTPVDIRESVIDVVRRMGLLEQIVAASLPPRPTEFLDANGSPIAQMPVPTDSSPDEQTGWEIERNTLLDMLFAQLENHVEFLWGNSITKIDECKDGLEITFANGEQRCFSLLLGCDGTHSSVRKMCFGEERTFSRFLQNYFSLTIVNKSLLKENTTQLFNVPGKTIMLNAYNGKTDIGFCFHSENEVSYDRHNQKEQKLMMQEHFETEGWRIPELLQEMQNSPDFYFDKLCQIRMEQWTKGRVALVGDAGYCPSPAAGMGGSMALLGAAALADGFKQYPNDYQQAFAHYQASLQPIVTAIQDEAIEVGLKMFAPTTEEAIRERNAQLNAG